MNFLIAIQVRFEIAKRDCPLLVFPDLRFDALVDALIVEICQSLQALTTEEGIGFSKNEEGMALMAEIYIVYCASRR